MTMKTAKKEEIIATKKKGAVYAPELKNRMKELLESNPKEFISIFKDMDSMELVELLGEEYIDKILSSMCSRRDMDTLRSFVNTFNLHISKSTKTAIAEAKEAVDKAITSLKEERDKRNKRNKEAVDKAITSLKEEIAKRNEEKIIIHCNSSSGFTGYFKEGGELNFLVFFEKNPGGSVNTVELKDVL